MSKQVILFSAGLTILAGWGLARWGAARPPTPGELVPNQPLIVWQGPSKIEKAPAKVRFLLDNRGGTPVRITEVQSGCGCTVPSFESGEIPPGGRGFVDASVRYFPVGERRVPLVVRTNSPRSPTVNLMVHLIGGGTPPFLLMADANLSFLGDLGPETTQDLVVHTIETSGGSQTPLFDELPPFLRIEPREVKEKPYVLPGTFDRQHRFKVSFATPPPYSPYQGEFFVVDPWNQARRQRIGLLASRIAPVRAAPAHLWLTRRDDGGKVEGRFVVLAQQPLKDLSAVVDGAAEGMVSVTRDDVNGATGATTFRLEFDPSRSAAGDRAEYAVRVTWADGPPGSPLVVPITLTR